MRRTTVRIIAPAAVLAGVAGITGIATVQHERPGAETASGLDRFATPGADPSSTSLGSAASPAPPAGAAPSASVAPQGSTGVTSPASESAASPLGVLRVDYNFERQPRAASNQFAIWLETADGGYVDTLFATSWIANGGWTRRPMAMPHWRETSRWADASQGEVEAASRPAPDTGSHTVYWDGTDYAGDPVPAGDYVLKVEGNVEWEHMVAFEARVRIGREPLGATAEETVNDQPEDTMLSDVTVSWLAGQDMTDDMTTEFTRGS